MVVMVDRLPVLTHGDNERVPQIVVKREREPVHDDYVDSPKIYSDLEVPEESMA